MVNVLYCDLATMPCTAEDIERALSKFATAVVRVKPNLWFFDAKKGPYGIDFLGGLSEYVLDFVLADLIGKNGEVMCFTMDRSVDFQLPEIALEFYKEHYEEKMM